MMGTISRQCQNELKILLLVLNSYVANNRHSSLNQMMHAKQRVCRYRGLLDFLDLLRALLSALLCLQLVLLANENVYLLPAMTISLLCRLSGESSTRITPTACLHRCCPS